MTEPTRDPVEASNNLDAAMLSQISVLSKRVASQKWINIAIGLLALFGLATALRVQTNTDDIVAAQTAVAEFCKQTNIDNNTARVTFVASFGDSIQDKDQLDKLVEILFPFHDCTRPGGSALITTPDTLGP